MKAFALLLATCACSTTLDAKNYASDCDADDQCVIVVVGDICSCGCDIAAINDRDYDKYTNDIFTTGGCRNPPICNCGAGIGAKCEQNRCNTYVLPADAGE